MNVTIVSDTSESSHFGCKLVMEAINEQLKRIGAKVIKSNKLGVIKPEVPNNTDLILVNGEGSVHHGRNNNLLSVTKFYPKIPAVFFNAVWDSNPEYECLKDFKLITVRESESLKQLPSFVKGLIVPDVAFIANKLTTFLKPNSTKDICITDNVIEGDNFDLSAKGWVNPLDYIKNMSKYSRVCSGRHHSVCVAASLGIPFSAWPSNTHKIYGMMNDMGIPQHHYTTKKEAVKNVPDNLDKKVKEYVKEAKEKIISFFDNLYNL